VAKLPAGNQSAPVAASAGRVGINLSRGDVHVSENSTEALVADLRAHWPPAATSPAPATAVSSASAAPAVPRLPPPRHCFGREDAVPHAVAAVLAKPAAPLAILGPSGVGKTTVAVTALHSPRVVRRFRSRRFFVRADGASGRDARVAAIAAAEGLETGPGLEQRTWRELESGAVLLVLDNAETPWDADPQRSKAKRVTAGRMGRARPCHQ
jgi:hypothetical protein